MDKMPLGQKIFLWGALITSLLSAGALIRFDIMHTLIHVFGVIASVLFFFVLWPFVLFMVGREVLDALRKLFGKDPVSW